MSRRPAFHAAPLWHGGLLANSLDHVLVLWPKDEAAGSPRCVVTQMSATVGLESRLGGVANLRLGIEKEVSLEWAKPCRCFHLH